MRTSFLKVMCIEGCPDMLITDSICDRKKQPKRNMLTEGKVQDIYARLEISTHKWLMCLAQQTGVLRVQIHSHKGN